MENQGVEIQSVQFDSGNIVVSYVNGATESYPNDHTTYKLMHEKWLVNNPPFISDIYKVHMRNLILTCINDNEKCCCELKNFFAPPNEEAVKKFLTYMRKRDDILPAKRAIWTIPPSASSAV
jgi:hypothetical protein